MAVRLTVVELTASSKNELASFSDKEGITVATGLPVDSRINTLGIRSAVVAPENVALSADGTNVVAGLKVRTSIVKGRNSTSDVLHERRAVGGTCLSGRDNCLDRESSVEVSVAVLELDATAVVSGELLETSGESSRCIDSETIDI